MQTEENATRDDLHKIFIEYYDICHPYIVLMICAFGICTNILNFVVLTRDSMRENPTNVILSGLAPAQLMLLVNYTIYTVYEWQLGDQCNFEAQTFIWLFVIAAVVNLNIIFHTIGLIHTIFLAVFRYLTIHNARLVQYTDRDAKLAVLMAYLTTPILCVSFFFNSQIHRITVETQCAKKPDWEIYKLAFRKDFPALLVFNFWLFAICCKILPCIALSVFSFLLIKDLRRVNRLRRATLRSSERQRRTNKQHRMTNIMLVIIVLLFVAVELPQGIMNAFSAMLGDDFRQEYYIPSGNFFEMLTALGSSINFVLYCVMSSQFRHTFRRTFLGYRESSEVLAESLGLMDIWQFHGASNSSCSAKSKA